MEEIVKASNTEIAETNVNNVIQITEDLLFDAKANVSDKQTISMPIAELSSLGAGVSSLLPSLRTVVETTSFNADGLYRLANADVGDVLKLAKDGNFWGAYKTAAGGSKFAKLAEAGSVSTTSTTVMPIDPATMMIAVALFSIEKQLKGIEETCKKILSFLENEKEAKIEGDIETLMSIISKFKYSWDNKQFMTANYKMVADLQRTARANINSYQKKLSGITSSKQVMLAQSQVQKSFNDLLKDFKYYRLSLYTFSLASMLEILLGGNFKEEYILGVKDEVTRRTNEYRDMFDKCSLYLEKKSKGTLDTGLLKGIGEIGNAAGNVIGAIPLVNKGPVDEFLQDSGKGLKQSAKKQELKVVKTFSQMNNPNTSVFVEKMNDLILIYNHTSEICFDNNNIYLRTQV